MRLTPAITAFCLMCFVADYKQASASPSYRRRLEQRSNDKFPARAWSTGSKKSSPITYINLPFANWFSPEGPSLNSRPDLAEERSNPIISNSIADDFLFGSFKKPLQFISNGKPINIFQLKKTTTTTAPPLMKKDDSSITWLGNFLMNGLPKKIFDFKPPYSPFSWFSKLGEDQLAGQNIV